MQDVTRQPLSLQDVTSQPVCDCRTKIVIRCVFAERGPSTAVFQGSPGAKKRGSKRRLSVRMSGRSTCSGRDSSTGVFSGRGSSSGVFSEHDSLIGVCLQDVARQPLCFQARQAQRSGGASGDSPPGCLAAPPVKAEFKVVTQLTSPEVKPGCLAALPAHQITPDDESCPAITHRLTSHVLKAQRLTSHVLQTRNG